MEVNGRSLLHATLDETYQILGNLQQGEVKFVIKRFKDPEVAEKLLAKTTRGGTPNRALKAQSDTGEGLLKKWNNLSDLREPPKEILQDLMTPAIPLSEYLALLQDNI